MRRPLSLGAKLALRYTAAMAVTVTVFAAVVYKQVESRINRDAALLLEVRLQDLVDAIGSQSAEHKPEHVRAWLESHIAESVAHAEPTLGLGIEFLDAEGRSVIVGGSLAGQELPLSRALLDGRRDSSLRAVNLGGRYAHLAAAAPVEGGFARVAIDTTRYAENIASIRRIFLFSLPLVLVMTAAGGGYLAAQSLKPIAAINATARRISGSNLRELIPVRGSRDELDELAITLNDMLARIHEGVERMKRFNANAAHQLRTPLTAIQSEVEVTLERPRTPNEYRSVLGDVHDEVRRMANVVDAMLRLARSEAGLSPEQRGPVAVESLLAEVMDFFAPVAQERGVDLAGGTFDAAVVNGERSWLHQMLANLVANGIEYSGAGGCVELSARRKEGWVEIHVADTGPGISPEELVTVFERFARGEGGPGRGFGLGLPIAREIARAHGGQVEVESEPGRGATFSVRLPLAEGDASVERSA